jgi:hypothetical protein
MSLPFPAASDDRTGSSALGLLANPVNPGAEAWDPVEAYFECITTCSLEDGECVTQCVERLREEG